MTLPDTLTRADTFRLGSNPSDADVERGNILIHDLSVALEKARAEAEAMVEAALRKAAEAASACWDDPQMRNAILALIPPAGQSALDSVAAAAVKAERERCAKVAEDYSRYDHLDVDGYVMACNVSDGIATAIRAQGDA